ncbi:hypothetical protein PV08_03030 [Exophiala spinifera]|uniref:AB hydrolase-1 domain-containing protein n=1 Tax=Exophiala spinifera TaxID=91928 RepID=A0A0D1YU02_9EURO|nr:uncharacterized protein PV08_03030 [Exophiala spinifera]KIW18741.1 hypothetical protein PV08_03030 [Exophiala spinifera]
MFPFRTVEHKVPCQYIREYPQALANEQEDTLHLAVKQYIPLDNPHPRPGDVTIIAAPGNAFPKELYEPLWEDLSRVLLASKASVRIRSIWIADVASQGASGVLNEDLLGDDPSHSDYARDIVNLVNIKREEMPRPIIGIGHSMGGLYLVSASLYHPRLFTTLVLLDPVVQPRLVETKAGTIDFRPLQFALFRQRAWPSREAAAADLARSPFHKSWDPRALDRWVKYGVREVSVAPESSNRDEGPGRDITTAAAAPAAPTPAAVVLTTPPSQEAFALLRPNFDGYGVDGTPVNQKTHPDLDPKWRHIYPFYGPAFTRAFERLGELRPPTLYVFASDSSISDARLNAEKLAATGTAVGGSGGVAAGRVEGVTFDGVGHLIPMEAPRRTAEVVADWLDRQLSLWKKDEGEFRSMWHAKSKSQRQEVDARWVDMVGGVPGNTKGKNGRSVGSNSKI